MEKTMWKRTFAAMIIVALIMIPVIIFVQPTLMFFGGGGSTIIVDANGNGDYTSIETALNNANEWDTLRIWDGIYSSDVVVDTRGVQLIGNGTSTVIECVGSYGIELNESDLTVKDIWLRNGSLGIHIKHGVDNISIDGLRITNLTSDGIKTEEIVSPTDWSYLIQVSNIEIYDIDGNGIRMFFATQSSVQDSVIHNYGTNHYGIVFTNSAQFNLIDNCEVYNGRYGIGAGGSSHGVNMTNNQIYDCTLAGLTVATNSSFGMVVGNSIDNCNNGIRIFVEPKYNIITENIVSNCSTGIFLLGQANFNLFTYNIIRDNDLGISIQATCTDNEIYGNNFINNIVHAQDGNTNIWNTTIEEGGGNHWDDYLIPDDNNDGFVDIPRSVDTFVYDFLPLTDFITPPVSDSVDEEYWYYEVSQDEEIQSDLGNVTGEPEEIPDTEVIILDTRLQMVYLLIIIDFIIILIATGYDIMKSRAEGDKP